MRNIKKFAAISLICLLAAGTIACGASATPVPTSTPAPPTATPAPDTPTPQPTATPRPTNTTAPTATPQPTNTPSPTATPRPTDTPPAPPPPTTQLPPSPPPLTPPPPPGVPVTYPPPTPEGDPVADALAPLGDNLLWVAHYDNSTKQISVYDPSGAYSLEALLLPPGLSINETAPPLPLTRLISGKIYFIAVTEAQEATMGGKTRNLSAGVNIRAW